MSYVRHRKAQHHKPSAVRLFPIHRPRSHSDCTWYMQLHTVASINNFLPRMRSMQNPLCLLPVSTEIEVPQKAMTMPREFDGMLVALLSDGV